MADKNESLMKFFNDFEIIMDDLAEDFKDRILRDYEESDKNRKFDSIIAEIVKLSQEIEVKLRKVIKSKTDKEYGERVSLDKAPGGRLIKEISALGIFDDSEIGKLKKIIDLRNWVMHVYYAEYYEEAAKRADVCGWSNMRDFSEKSNFKLVFTKHMMFETIDFIDNYLDVDLDPESSQRPTVLQ